MSDLVNIKDERFWQILFDEACVEGQQAERIEKELKKITVEPVDGEWIPVSERLPENETEVEISCIRRYIGAGNVKKEAQLNAAELGELLFLIAARLDEVRTEYATIKTKSENTVDNMECVVMHWKLSQLQKQIDWLEFALYRKNDVHA